MDMPVRVAFPIDTNRMPPGRNGPEYTCASGIIRYALEQERDRFRYIEQPLDQLRIQGRNIGISGGKARRDYAGDQGDGEQNVREGSILQSIKDVFKELF
jgi:cell division protein FtsA